MTTELHNLAITVSAAHTRTHPASFPGVASNPLPGPHTPQPAVTNREQHEQHELWNSCGDSAPTPAVFIPESQIKNPVCSPAPTRNTGASTGWVALSFKIPLVNCDMCAFKIRTPSLSFIMNYLGTFLQASQSRVIYPRSTGLETGDWKSGAGSWNPSGLEITQPLLSDRYSHCRWSILHHLC